MSNQPTYQAVGVAVRAGQALAALNRHVLGEIEELTEKHVASCRICGAMLLVEIDGVGRWHISGGVSRKGCLPSPMTAAFPVSAGAEPVTKFTTMVDAAERLKPSRKYFTRANTERRTCEGCGLVFLPKKGTKGRFHSIECCRQFWHRERSESPVRVAQRRETLERSRARDRAEDASQADSQLSRPRPVHQFIPEVKAPPRGSIALVMLGCRIYG